MSSEKIKSPEVMECASCGAFIPTAHDAHDGAPVVDGQVCIECNYMDVVPARLAKLGVKADPRASAAALTRERERMRQVRLSARAQKRS
jgi:hypothetical protein